MSEPDDDFDKEYGPPPPPHEIRKRERERRQQLALVEIDVSKINEDHALVITGGHALVMREGRPPEFLTPTAFRLYYNNVTFYLGGRDRIGLGDLWLGHDRRRQYERVTFAPPGLDVSPGTYNLWRGFAVQSVAGELAKVCPTFVDHVKTNIAGGDPEIVAWVWAWFAEMVQAPARRTGVSLVLRGGEGVGKTKLGEVVGSLFPDHYLLVDDPRYISGNFNSHMAACLLLQSDEAFWAGDPHASGRIKGLISSRVQMIERKGVDPIVMPNFVRLLVTSNSGWVVPAGFDSRRFCVLDVKEYAKQNSAYFAEIDREMDAGGRAVLLHYLQNFDLSSVDLRALPRTAALLEQRLASAEPHFLWWHDCLRNGAPTPQMDRWPDAVQATSLLRSYQTFCDGIGYRGRRLSEAWIGRVLRRVLPATADGTSTLKRERRSVVETIDPETTRMRRRWHYLLPPLQDCKDSFMALLNTQEGLDWDDEEIDGAVDQ